MKSSQVESIEEPQRARGKGKEQAMVNEWVEEEFHLHEPHVFVVQVVCVGNISSALATTPPVGDLCKAERTSLM